MRVPGNPMTVEQLVCVCFGFLFEGMTFILGIMVGITMRKGVKHHGDYDGKAVWHQVERR